MAGFTPANRYLGNSARFIQPRSAATPLRLSSSNRPPRSPAKDIEAGGAPTKPDEKPDERPAARVMAQKIAYAAAAAIFLVLVAFAVGLSVCDFPRKDASRMWIMWDILLVVDLSILSIAMSGICFVDCMDFDRLQEEMDDAQIGITGD